MQNLQIIKMLLKLSKHCPSVQHRAGFYRVLFCKMFSKYYFVNLYILQIFYSHFHFCLQKIYSANLCNYSIKLLKISKTFT